MLCWLTSLFSNKQKHKTRRRRNNLTPEEVLTVEDCIKLGYTRDALLEELEISISTYYKIKSYKHKYSAKD